MLLSAAFVFSCQKSLNAPLVSQKSKISLVMRALLREKISRGEQKMRGEGMVGSVELRVSEDSEEILVYTFKTAREAGEMVRFLSEFLPNARFLVQPLTH